MKLKRRQINNKRNRAKRVFGLYVFAWVLSAALLACTGTKEASREDAAPKPREAARQQPRPNRDAAVQHFVEGSLSDLKGDYAKAILEYQDALRLDKDPAIYYALSRDYKFLGKYYLAAENGKEATRLDPTNVTYREHLAEVYLAANEPDSALQQYREVLAIDSAHTGALYGLARIYQQRGAPLEAINTYNKLLDLIGLNWDVLVQLSQLYEQLQRYEDAAEAYQEMLSIDPANLDLKKRLIEMYLRAGKPDSALERLDELLDVERSNPDVQALIGDIYLEKNDVPKALEYFDPVLQGDSVAMDTKLHVVEGMLQHSQKDSTLVDRARPILENLQRHSPSDWRPYWYLGFVGFSTRNDSFALKNFRKVTELTPRNPDAWYYTGTIYFRMGLHDSAAYSLERSVEINPRNVDALGALGLTYDAMKRHVDSDRIYEQALRLDAHNHIILNNYSYSLAERGIELERALHMAREAVEKQPENSSYLDTIGWVYFKLGKYEEALKYIGKAVALRDAVGENGATLNDHLGDVYYMLNDKEKAMEYWKRALEMNSKNEALKSKIERGTLQ
jgi:tetratricopeptide (TPR) repeat protein